MGGDVRLKMSERRLLVKVEAERYRRARKKEKGRILDDLIALSGYNRWYAVGLLRDLRDNHLRQLRLTCSYRFARRSKLPVMPK